MKNATILILILFVVTIQSVSAQRSSDKYNRYFTKDQLSFTLVGSQWLAGNDAPRPSAFSRGINLQMMYPVIGKRSNVAMALGFGFASQNYFLDHFLISNHDGVWFTPIPDSLDYRKYKISTNYLTLPVELRIRTNPDKHYRRSFKIYPGFRIGGLVNVHTKYIGQDPQTLEHIKVKAYHIRHIDKLNYGITLRIGYGKIMAHGYYALNPLFDAETIEPVYPVELGISIVLF